MGVSVNAQKNSESEYVKSVKEVSNMIMKRASQPWLWNDLIYFLTKEGRKFKNCLKILHKFTQKIIENKLTLLKNTAGSNLDGGKSRLAFLDLLLQQHVVSGDFSLLEIREEVDTFMFEGHDTTSVGITWALYLIGLYNDVQNRIHQEVDEVFTEKSELEDVTLDDCKKMKYLECVLQESQRLYPSVPVMMRVLGEDTQIGDYIIPKDTNVSVPVYVMHRDPQIYNKPEVFDPDRFSATNTTTKHPYSYIPFSAGSRNCIGKRFAVMEEKIIIATILRRFSIRSLQSRDQVEIVPELVLRPLGDVMIKFNARNVNQ